jgi:hypothetical protein
MICDRRFTFDGAGNTRFSAWKLAGILIVVAGIFPVSDLQAFEGSINASLNRGGEIQAWTYTVGTNCLRIERGETNWPYAKNLIARDTGDVTLLFPHNRSFVRLKPAAENASAPMPAMPAPPPGIGPQTQLPPSVPPPTIPPPIGVGPTNLPGLPPRPAIPAMPMMPMPGEALELKATGETTNLFGYVCARYEIKQRGEIMEIWATDQLLPFQPWLPNQPPRFGPQMVEEKWGELLKTKKLFPLLVVLKFENGPERLRFAIISVKPQKIEDPDGALFQVPADYQEIEPLPF